MTYRRKTPQEIKAAVQELSQEAKIKWKSMRKTPKEFVHILLLCLNFTSIPLGIMR